MRLHRGAQEAMWTLATALLSIGAGCWVLKIWRADLRIPLKPEGDTYLVLTAIKGMLENGWYLANPALGAPHGQNVSDFGGFNGDSVNWLILRVLGFFIHDAATLLNVFYLLGFGLVGGAAYLVLRNVGVSRLTGLALSVFYANLSFHFTHGEGHLMLSAYFAVPAGAWLVLRVLTGRPLISRREGAGLRKWLTPLNAGTIAAVVVVGGGTLYYAIFTLLLLIFATPVRAIAVRSWRSLLSGAGAMMAVGIVLVINLAPAIAYRLANGPNLAVAVRSAYESELYSFSLTRLVAMVAGHRIDYLSDLGNSVARNSLTTGEGEVLGVVLGVTLLAMIGMVLVWLIRGTGATGPRAPMTNATLMGALLVFLLGTTGGVGALIANVVSPQIRVWGRLTPFLALFCIIILAFGVDWGRRQLVRVDSRRVLSSILPLLVVGIAIIDQTSPANIPDYSGGPARWNADARFVQQIEQAVPPGSQILQLPLHEFPEAGGVNGMGDYDHLTGYAHSTNLRWSYGSVKGRGGDWSAAAKNLPLATLLPAAATAGFAGAWVDNAAYTGGGRVIRARIQRIVGTSVRPIVSPDGRRAFYDLRPLAAQVAGVTTAPERRAIGDALVNPTTMDFGQGFYLFEQDGARTWHWATNDAVMTIANNGSTSQQAKWAGTLIGASGAKTTISANGRTLGTFATGTAGHRVSLRLTVPAGGLLVRFTTIGTDLGPQNNDPRSLYFQVANARITNDAFAVLTRALASSRGR